MSIIVLDTNIVSLLMRPGDRTLARRYETRLLGHELAISFMTVAELYQGALARSWGRARWKKLEELLEGLIIFPSSPDICEEWARIRVERRRQGRPISEADAWIAATARHHDLPLATHDRDMFEIESLDLVTELGD